MAPDSTSRRWQSVIDKNRGDGPTTIATPLPIMVWRFSDAPAYLRDISENGGDEDWLAVVPDALVEDGYPPRWLDVPAFGCCCVDRYPHPREDGFTVMIGCHA